MSTCIVSVMIYLAPNMMQKSQRVVDVINVTPMDAQKSISTSGTVEYANSVSVNSSVTALIKKVYVKSGERVKKGAKLYTLSEVMFKGLPSTDQLYSLKSVDEAMTMIRAKENYVETGNNIDILAPNDGVISCMSVKEGEVVMSNALLCTIVDPDKFLIKAMINESQVVNIKVGQPVCISGAGFEGEYSGKVESISNEAHSVKNFTGEKTGVDIVIRPDGYIPNLKHGFTVMCKIITEKSENVMMIPYEALEFENGVSYVRKLNTDGVIERVQVITGREYENGVEIVGGIDINDDIVKKGD